MTQLQSCVPLPQETLLKANLTLSQPHLIFKVSHHFQNQTETIWLGKQIFAPLCPLAFLTSQVLIVFPTTSAHVPESCSTWNASRTQLGSHSSKDASQELPEERGIPCPSLHPPVRGNCPSNVNPSTAGDGTKWKLQAPISHGNIKKQLKSEIILQELYRS